MEIITRLQAINNRQSRYFTGQSCKRGHLSERYTLNACCIECLHPKFESDDILARRAARLVEIGERRSQLEARRVSVAQMERFKVTLHSGDLEHFKTLIYLLSTMREPALNPDDIQTKCQPHFRGGLMSLYAFKIFAADKPALIQIALDLDWDRMSPETQASLIANQPRRIDGWVPPPLRTTQGDSK